MKINNLSLSLNMQMKYRCKCESAIMHGDRRFNGCPSFSVYRVLPSEGKEKKNKTIRVTKTG